jgi:hypothetical protein
MQGPATSPPIQRPSKALPPTRKSNQTPLGEPNMDGVTSSSCPTPGGKGGGNARKRVMKNGGGG